MRKSPTHSPSAEAFDRGPAKYFHGRKQILEDFGDLLWYSKQKEAGTTFLIQGAPGVGKSALLAECGKLAERRKWNVVDIPVRAIWSVDELRRALGRGDIPVATRGSAQVGGGPIGKLEITAELASETMLNLLRSGEDPLLLKLDEAQRIGTTVSRTNVDQFATATDVLYAIHNGELNRPIILITAGLGTTADAFGALGISRFAKRCLVELGALDKEAERAVLHDWLTKDGKAKGNPTTWIDAIAQEAHGWPQHILSYVDPALNQLHVDKRVMTAEGLNTVLKAGLEGRAAYYQQRLGSFRGDQIRCLARSVAGVAPGEPVEYRDIVSSLTTEYGDNESKQLFQRFIEKGILAKYGIGYAVPIPSMHDWLASNYVREQIKFPRETLHIQHSDDRNSGIDFGR